MRGALNVRPTNKNTWWYKADLNRIRATPGKVSRSNHIAMRVRGAAVRRSVPCVVLTLLTAIPLLASHKRLTDAEMDGFKGAVKSVSGEGKTGKPDSWGKRLAIFGTMTEPCASRSWRTKRASLIAGS